MGNWITLQHHPEYFHDELITEFFLGRTCIHLLAEQYTRERRPRNILDMPLAGSVLLWTYKIFQCACCHSIIFSQKIPHHLEMLALENERMAFWNVNITLKIESSEEKVLLLDFSEIPNHCSELRDIFLRTHGSKKQWGTSLTTITSNDTLRSILLFPQC